MKTSYEKRVKRGIEFLNEIEPKWYKKINLETLDIRKCNTCVCGQVFRKKPWPKDDLELYGMFGGVYQYNKSCAKLTEIWKKEIKKLQKEKR